MAVRTLPRIKLECFVLVRVLRHPIFRHRRHRRPDRCYCWWRVLHVPRGNFSCVEDFRLGVEEDREREGRDECVSYDLAVRQ